MGADGRFNLTVLERDATGKVVAWTNRKQTSGWMKPHPHVGCGANVDRHGNTLAGWFD